MTTMVVLTASRLIWHLFSKSYGDSRVLTAAPLLEAPRALPAAGNDRAFPNNSPESIGRRAALPMAETRQAPPVPNDRESPDPARSPRIPSGPSSHGRRPAPAAVPTHEILHDSIQRGWSRHKHRAAILLDGCLSPTGRGLPEACRALRHPRDLSLYRCRSCTARLPYRNGSSLDADPPPDR